MRVLDQLFRPSLPEGETQQTKKLPRDKCPISPTKSKSIGTEGSCPQPFRELGRGSAPGKPASHMYLTCFVVPMLPGRAPRLLCHTRRRHWREGQSCTTATLPKRAGKEGTVVSDARGVVVLGLFRELGRGSAPGWPASHMYLSTLPMLPGRAPRLLCHTRRRHWREGQSCNTATLPKRAGKERTVVCGAGKCLAASISRS